MGKSPDVVQVMSTVALLFELGGSERVGVLKAIDKTIAKKLSSHSGRDEWVKLLLPMEDSVYERLSTFAAEKVLAKSLRDSMLRKAEYNKLALRVAEYQSLDLTGSWSPSKAFLDALPSKAAICVELEASGFDKAFIKAHEEKGYKDFLKLKSDDFKTAIFKI